MFFQEFQVKQAIDFLVIGAQKSGTTSLFKYMQRHPALYLPPQKEVNFFVNEDRLQQGLDWYLQNFFHGVDEDKQWGEVSPSYMSFRIAPARIHALCPQVKLIACLRNPIDRTYSHYRMAVRRGTESRSFREVVEERLREPVGPPEVKQGRINDAPYLLEYSRYGETLQRYLRYFERERILILFQEDLAGRPQMVLEELFSFLGVDPGYRPPNLGREYHVGGEKRLPWLDEWVRRRTVLKWMAKKVLVSRRNVNAARFWFKQANIKPVKNEGPTSEERKLLQEVFAEDVALLGDLFDLEPPWREFKGSEQNVPVRERGLRDA